MTKRIASLLLVLILIAMSIPFSASAATNYTKTISGFNCTRYENYLVIYNQGTTTRTNSYGYEVTVTNGIVTSIGGNNSTIPQGDNSYVVSGHGTMRDWLADNIIVGMSVSYSTSTNKITFVLDEATRMRAINISRDAAFAARQKAIDACVIYDANADATFEEIEATYATILANHNNGTAPTLTQMNTMIDKYNSVTALFNERAVSEYRGVWIRPTQTSATAVDSYVKKCYDAGINMISVETMYHGSMIYPTPNGSLIKHNPKFYGFDVLGAYVESCHKYGMELHVWMPVFYSCNTVETNWNISPAKRKPEWCLVTQKGSKFYTGESEGMVFLNPALPEVQDFLVETYAYILSNYDIDGFQLDYIRYRDRTQTDDYGYDEYTISEFKKEYPQYSKYNITYDTSAIYWDNWVAFRANYVTQFVQRMRTLIDTIAPDVMLTADVGPQSRTAYNDLYQNYTMWLNEEWLDMIHPMAYGEGYELVMKDFFKMAGENCLVVPGLGIFMEEYGAQDMLRQTRAMLEVGCDGVVYFEASAFFSKGCGTVLTQNIFTEKALAPALDTEETFKANLERMKERVAKAKASGTISNTIAAKLTTLIDEALGYDKISDAKNTLTELSEALENISSELLYNRLYEDIVRSRQVVMLDLRDASTVFETLGDKIYCDGLTNYIILGRNELPLGVDDLKAALPDGEVKKGSKVLGSDDLVSTGSVLTNDSAKFTIVVIGDVSGDGKVSAQDYIKIKRQVLKTTTLNGAESLAADIHENGTVNARDYLQIKRHVLGTTDIYA